MRNPALALILGAAFSLLAPVAATAAATPAPAPSAVPAAAATPDPVDDPKMNKLAQDQLAAAQSGKLDRTLFNAAFNKTVTDDTMAGIGKILGKYGKPKSFIFVTVNNMDGVPTYRYVVAWPGLTMIEDIGLDKDGKIGILAFQKAP